MQLLLGREKRSNRERINKASRESKERHCMIFQLTFFNLVYSVRNVVVYYLEIKFKPKTNKKQKSFQNLQTPSFPITMEKQNQSRPLSVNQPTTISSAGFRFSTNIITNKKNEKKNASKY